MNQPFMNVNHSLGAGVSESGAGASIALHIPVLMSFTGGYFFSASSFTSTPQPGPVGMWKTEFSTLGTTVTISSFHGLSPSQSVQ